jgi:hypothetical protein
MADLALESDQVDEGERKVPAHQAEKEDAIEEFRERTTPDAAESGNYENHGLDSKDGPVKARAQRERKREEDCRVIVSAILYVLAQKRAVK